MELIHDARYLSKEEILKRTEKYEFPNPPAVELFLCWLSGKVASVCLQKRRFGFHDYVYERDCGGSVATCQGCYGQN